LSDKKEFYDVYIAASMTGCRNDNEYEQLRNKIIKLKEILMKKNPELKVFYAGDEIESLEQVSELSDTNAANVVMDIENIFEAQYFILIYPEKATSSTLVEAGCALSLKKKSLYCVKDKDDLPYMLKHSPEAYPFVKISQFNDVDEIIEKIRNDIDIFEGFYTDIKKQITSGIWKLNCPVCGEKINFKIIPCSKIRLSCGNDNCKFEINSPILWYNMSTLSIKDKVMSFGLDSQKSHHWAYTLKYTHPSYSLSQESERTQAKLELQNLFKLTVKNFKYANILLVGSNSCMEMDSYPYEYDKNNFWGIDLSEELINKGKLNAKYSKCNFKITSIEDLYLDSKSPKKNIFDLVIALRVIQSRMDLNKTLRSISDALKLGGKAIISIPKQTSLIEADCSFRTEPRIIKISPKTGKPIDSYVIPLNELNIIVDKIKERDEFTNISVYHGNLSSIEYYITFEKTM
jgi:SAM-dependent methyltransferase